MQKQLHLISVTDRRAINMITISTVLIPFMVNFMGESCYRWSAGMMLLTLVASLITAIFSLFPQNPSGGMKSPNLYHFRDIAKHDEDAYLAAMRRILNNEEEPGPVMTTDIYRTARYILNPKVRLLSLSYYAFMTGGVLAVVTFLVLQLTGFRGLCV